MTIVQSSLITDEEVSGVLALNCFYILCTLHREVKLSGPQSKKTYEELQLEEVKRLQNETRKKLRASRRSFANLSKTSAPVRVKGTMPTTEPVEFHFHQTNREKKGAWSVGRAGYCC